MTTQTHTIKTQFPRLLQPDRKHWHATEYPYHVGSPPDSLAAAACAFMSAHYRLRNRVVKRFNHFQLAFHLGNAADPWETCLTHLLELGVPFDPPMGSLVFTPVSGFRGASLSEVLAPLGESPENGGGPVLLWLPWSPVYDHTSKAWGCDWVGPDGVESRGQYFTEFRGVLVTGVRWRGKGVRLLDGTREVWMSFSELKRTFENSAQAFTAIYA